MNSDTGAPVVKIGDDGQVLQCAKGADVSACGYKTGDSVCVACGATAMEVKMYGMGSGLAETDSDETHVMPDGTVMAGASHPKKKKKKKKNPFVTEEKAYGAPPPKAYGDFVDDEELMGEFDDEEDDDDDSMMPKMDDPEDETEEMSEAIMMGAPPMRKNRKSAYVDHPDFLEDEDEDEDEMFDMDDMDDEEVSSELRKMFIEDEMEEEENMEYSDRGMFGKSDYANLRLSTLGFKAGEMGEDPFVCAIERKVYPAGSPVCENCPGGCKKEGDMPALLEMEGVAEDMFGGKVLDSGYSDKADIFVVDVERKDGKPVEAFFDGTTGECMGWHLLNDEVLNVKSGFQPTEMIGFSEAAQIATKSINGDVVSVEADVFEGFDSYAVEIEGVDGKSYDVFVSLDGEVLGYDTYTQQEAFAIESEAAEIALKRAYGEEAREKMAERGDAMQDGEMPISNDSDLRNAVMAWPRSQKRQEAKDHIMARAHALGLEKSLPDEWLQLKVQNDVAKNDANFMSSLAEFEILSTDIPSVDPSEEKN